MFTYWFLFVATLPGIFIDPRLKSVYARLYWISIVTISIFIIGFRYRVGCDWQSYTDLFDAIRNNRDFGYRSLNGILNWGPAYLALNWLSAKFHLGIYFVNLVCGVLTIGGLTVFCRTLPLPWLGWTVATPYFVVVVSMGYTRQAVAIGLFFWALRFLQSRKTVTYFSIVVLASMFHMSALILLPLGLVPFLQSQPRKYIPLFVLFIVVLGIALGPYAIVQVQSYLHANQHSSGAVIRTLMTAIPAAFLFIFLKDWKQQTENLSIWLILSLASFVALGLVWFMSTAVDRISLYLIPLQVFILSSIPVLPRFRRYYNFLLGFLVFYSAAILWVWLNLGINSRCWVPYWNLFFKLGKY